MFNFCVEILVPIIIIIATILIVGLFIAFIAKVIDEMKKEENNNDVCNEPKADKYKVQRAIIVLGNEKIEVEVCDYEIEDNIVEIESIDGRVFITDTKNVLLMN